MPHIDAIALQTRGRTCVECHRLSMFSRFIAIALLIVNPAMLFLLIWHPGDDSYPLAWTGLTPTQIIALAITALWIVCIGTFVVLHRRFPHHHVGLQASSIAQVTFFVITVAIVASLFRLSLSLWLSPWQAQHIDRFVFPPSLFLPVALLGLATFSHLLNVPLPGRELWIRLAIGVGLLAGAWDQAPYEVSVASLWFRPIELARVEHYVGLVEFVYLIAASALIAHAAVIGALRLREVTTSVEDGDRQMSGWAPWKRILEHGLGAIYHTLQAHEMFRAELGVLERPVFKRVATSMLALTARYQFALSFWLLDVREAWWAPDRGVASKARLRALGGAIRSALRLTALASEVDPGRFLVLLPGMDREHGQQTWDNVADRVRGKAGGSAIRVSHVDRDAAVRLLR